MKTIRFTLGGLLTFIGVILFVVSVFAIIDPTGTQMANDHDPFGPPQKRLYSSLIGLSALGISVVGINLFKKRSVSERS